MLLLPSPLDEYNIVVVVLELGKLNANDVVMIAAILTTTARVSDEEEDTMVDLAYLSIVGSPKSCESAQHYFIIVVLCQTRRHRCKIPHLPRGTSHGRPNSFFQRFLSIDASASITSLEICVLMSVRSKSCRHIHNLLCNIQNNQHEALPSSSRLVCIGRSGQCFYRSIEDAHQPQHGNTNICS